MASMSSKIYSLIFICPKFLSEIFLFRLVFPLLPPCVFKSQTPPKKLNPLALSVELLPKECV